MNVDVTSRGPVDPKMVELAQESLADLETAVGRSLGQARVVLEQEKPSFPNPARAEGDVSLGGKTIRGQVAADSMPRAIHDLAERLQQQLRRHIDRLNTRKRQATEEPEGRWNHGTWVPLRPSQSLLAPGEREIIRRKVFSLVPLSAIEAAELMSELDHGFYLFHDSDTDADSVVYLRDDGKLAVIAPQDAPAPPETDGPDGILRERSHYSGPLTQKEAVNTMNELNHRFLFFQDEATKKGVVLYLRHDGHYGLIEQEA